MIIRLIFISFLILLISACSGGNSALRTAQMQSELSYMEGSKAKIESEKLSLAKVKLDSSKKAEEVGDDQLALVLAELSNLRYRIVFAETERDKALADSAFAAEGLLKDKKRLEEYKALLKNEKSEGVKK